MTRLPLLITLTLSATCAVAEQPTAVSDTQPPRPVRISKSIASHSAADIAKLTAKAKAGDADAQGMLGRCYIVGDGVQTDYTQGIKWLQQAAEQKNAFAHCRLALCYLEGRGVPQNEAKGLEHLRQAAELGDVQAQSCLGFYYLKGQGVPKDEKKAVELIRQAAEQGDAQAQFLLGVFYYEMGIDGKPDMFEGFNWIMRAADQGHPAANAYFQRRQ